MVLFSPILFALQMTRVHSRKLRGGRTFQQLGTSFTEYGFHFQKSLSASGGGCQTAISESSFSPFAPPSLRLRLRRAVSSNRLPLPSRVSLPVALELEAIDSALSHLSISLSVSIPLPPSPEAFHSFSARGRPPAPSRLREGRPSPYLSFSAAQRVLYHL